MFLLFFHEELFILVYIGSLVNKVNPWCIVNDSNNIKNKIGGKKIFLRLATLSSSNLIRNMKLGTKVQLIDAKFWIDFHLISYNRATRSFFLCFLFFFYFVFLLYRYGQVMQSCMKKVVFLVLFFSRNISKTAETILIKKIGRNQGISVYKKALISEHRKIIFFEILIILAKCLLVC